MSRLLWMALGALGITYYNKIKREGRTPPLQQTIADVVERLSERGRTVATRLRETPVASETPKHEKSAKASTYYGAGTASLEPLPGPMASTMYSAGTASLNYEEQAIRDDKK